ncbi:hypothetical protein QO003_003073 [Arthrobacter silviterrae]|nr:hypothetical protein [Arthrobacter silviterrae]
MRHSTSGVFVMVSTLLSVASKRKQLAISRHVPDPARSVSRRAERTESILIVRGSANLRRRSATQSALNGRYPYVLVEFRGRSAK